MATVEVKSEITGKVWKIETKPGDRLEEDDAILILESMKMEIPVCAPADCKLVEILVAEEDSVSEGQVVAIVEEE
ncbi:acetyl-CoA carboxylase biotin carboxyl carrier protein subunit [Parvibaculum sp.]|uniref:acetyl-CoA carboxylase biotin carboxyl carrier protein subunit n=1 Tax=Parvibaculum sp. TaxID=2024848 RepID=UPI002722B83C|nr:acetyl-CoA carboxylase biotin carboxyl carrier protein subunit [Parvibaculum sp.]MDO9125629.1 acetyl-CoA carboxylase biotin carboxyl carrier protein subunit [Parvibaculum sp.]MDP1628185.1 acetyl-CoA carboxylase biotin carboxyl carrier protein subunit [Parvibaculum sp.]MDP2148025.1 acetyl-CoA carboxylase biotin carboxyl carrier protein subunit [Parvibaculum sp.]MDP3326903.1 acetyl-CoA carboxylase biotin carboxyl carrier protein subunit [Parvibaculum sp.]